MSILEIFLCILSVLCSSTGQLCFKKATCYPSFRLALPFWGMGGGLMLASVFLCVKVLQTVPLSALVPFAALVYILTPLGAQLIFKEKIYPRFWIGAGLIAVGVGLTMLR